MSIPMHSAQLLVTVASFVIFLIMIFTPQLSGLFVKFAHADFNFAVGDWGCNSNTKNTVTNIQGKKPERVTRSGRLFIYIYRNLLAQYNKPYQEHN